MTPFVLWIVVAVAFAVAELMTGTFYLLVLAVGAASGALVLKLGLGTAAQLMAAAVVALVGAAVVHRFRPQASHPDAKANPDVNPDIGQVVRIAEITPDGGLRVDYRGTTWTAELERGAADKGIDYVIVRVDGMKLILAPRVK